MACGPESGQPGVSIRPVKPTRPTDTVQHTKYCELVARLIDDFQQRFEDFRKHTDIMKLLSDPFSTKWTTLTFRITMTWTELLASKICWALTVVMFHQTVTPVFRGMPRISLLCLEAVGATNTAAVLENEKHKNEINVSAYKWTFDNIAYFNFYCWSRYRLLMQT